MVATIYYLDWAHKNADETAQALFHALHRITPNHLPRNHYRQIATTDHIDEEGEDGVHSLYKHWNATDEVDSHDPVFETSRMCERCGAVFEADDTALDHAEDVHDWQTFTDSLPDYIHAPRSMSVGDVIDLDGTLYMVSSPCGFTEVEWSERIPATLNDAIATGG